MPKKTTEEKKETKVEAAGLGDGVMLFATKTCPKCKVAMSLLDKAGIEYIEAYGKYPNPKKDYEAYKNNLLEKEAFKNGNLSEKIFEYLKPIWKI